MIDFLGIGAQKAGTTWLYRQLEAHPQVRFPAGKEAHFWDETPQRGAAAWLALFPDAPPGVRQGEITPAYATLDAERVEEIARHCPGLRLFVSLRNPVERAWSAALMALARAELRPHEASDQWFLDHFRSAGSRARGDYTGCIERWESAFPAGRLHVIWFDDLRERPREVLRDLARHLEVDPRFWDGTADASLRAPVFAGPPVPPRPSLAAALGELYAPQIDALERRFERDLTAWRTR